MDALESPIEAAKQGDMERVQAILDRDGSLVNRRDESGATPLHYAAFHGHRPIAQWLVERGADINAADTRFGATPAGWAIEYLREMGGQLAIERSDLEYAIRLGDTRLALGEIRQGPCRKLRSVRRCALEIAFRGCAGLGAEKRGAQHIFNCAHGEHSQG